MKRRNRTTPRRSVAAVESLYVPLTGTVFSRSVNTIFVVEALAFSRSVSVCQPVASEMAGTDVVSVEERISKSWLGWLGSGLKTTISLISGRPLALAAVPVGLQTTSVLGNVEPPDCSLIIRIPGNDSL